MHNIGLGLLVTTITTLLVTSVHASSTNRWLTDSKYGVKLWSSAPVKGESVAWHGHADGANGLGVAIWKVNGSETEVAAGSWKGGKLDTYGVWQHRDGDRYEGQWKNGEKHGFGVYTWPNGAYFCGAYQTGKRQGGIFYPADGGTADKKTPSAAEKKQAFKAESAAITAREIAGKARRKLITPTP